MLFLAAFVAGSIVGIGLMALCASDAKENGKPYLPVASLHDCFLCGGMRVKDCCRKEWPSECGECKK